MKLIDKSALKSILHSKRANIYYLQYCRIVVNGGRVEYITEEGNRYNYYNIPIANTTCIMLGTGTSITQAAAMHMSRAGVLVCFCGGGGTPIFSGSERPLIEESSVDLEVYYPQSEYRPSEYFKSWVGIWIDESKRLDAAKEIQKIRYNEMVKVWRKNFATTDLFDIDMDTVDKEVEKTLVNIEKIDNVTGLLTEEGRMTKKLYSMSAFASGYGNFVRTRANAGTGTDVVNNFLNHGNYLVYGLSATTLWVLGVPQSMPVLHGQTRRGGLVFDIADLIKDVIILPQAFISAAQNQTEKEFRMACLNNFANHKSLDFLFNSFKKVCEIHGSNNHI